MVLSLLAIASFASWLLSMLAGAGSPLVLIPLVTWLCGSAAVAPIITLGMLLGNGQRILLFWSHIDWRSTCWYLPGAIAGAIGGAYLFSRMNLGWLQWVIALALIAMALDFWWDSRHGEVDQAKQSAPEPLSAWAFLPLALVNGIASALIGSTGPILNPAYLGYGLVKEDMIATKAFHNSSLHIVKLAAYLYFGSFTQMHLGYGLVIGLAAIPGNWIGRLLLQRMSVGQFKQSAFAFIAFSGLLMLWQQTALAL